MIKRFLLALQFLTIFTVKRDLEAGPAELAGSTACFPLVGAVQGIVLATADHVLLKVLPVGVESALVLVVYLCMNNGLHLDGFVDTLDGLAGGATPEERLAIMRDSRAGALGVVGAVLLLLVKFKGIEALTPGLRGTALFILPVVGRWAIVAMATHSKYARDGAGLGRAFVPASRGALAAATFAAALPTVVLLGPKGALALCSVAALSFAAAVFFKKNLGGVTGDVLGFHSEASELVFLILVIAIC